MAKAENLRRLHQAEPPALTSEKAPVMAQPERAERPLRARFAIGGEDPVAAPEQRIGDRQSAAIAANFAGDSYTLDGSAVASLIGQSGVAAATGGNGGDRATRALS
jgi:hypothetical protein